MSINLLEFIFQILIIILFVLKDYISENDFY